MNRMALKSVPFLLTDAQVAWVENTRAGLSAQEKIGQLFVVMGGDYSDDTLKAMVAQGRIGGILFRPVDAFCGLSDTAL